MTRFSSSNRDRVPVFLKEFAKKLRVLLAEHHNPQEIALGVAIGVFIGFSPFYGFHTLLAILVSVLIHKANRLAVLLGTQVSIPFIAPAIYWAEYKIGKVILSAEMRAAAENGREWNHIELGLLYVLLGSILLGLASSAAAYFISLWVAKKLNVKKGLI